MGDRGQAVRGENLGSKGLYVGKKDAALRPSEAPLVAPTPRLDPSSYTPLDVQPTPATPQQELPDVCVPHPSEETVFNIPQSLNVDFGTWYSDVAMSTVLSDISHEHVGTPFVPPLSPSTLEFTLDGDPQSNSGSSTKALHPESAVTEHHIAALRHLRDGHTQESDFTSLLPQNTPGSSSQPSPSRHKRPRPRSPAHVPKKRKGSAEPLSAEDTTDSAGRLFTCPYVWYDPLVYQTCLKYKLKRIRDVKQHLQRVHKQPLFCPRCKTPFKGKAEQSQLNTHLQCTKEDICEVSLAKDPDGIDESQKKSLGQYPEAKKDLVAQWYTIWDIVFPGCQRSPPESPYIDEHRPGAIVSLISFIQKDGRRILGSDPSTSHIVEEIMLGVPALIAAHERASRPGQNHFPVNVQVPADIGHTFGPSTMAWTDGINREKFATGDHDLYMMAPGPSSG